MALRRIFSTILFSVLAGSWNSAPDWDSLIHYNTKPHCAVSGCKVSVIKQPKVKHLWLLFGFSWVDRHSASSSTALREFPPCSLKWLMSWGHVLLSLCQSLQPHILISLRPFAFLWNTQTCYLLPIQQLSPVCYSLLFPHYLISAPTCSHAPESLVSSLVYEAAIHLIAARSFIVPL